MVDILDANKAAPITGHLSEWFAKKYDSAFKDFLRTTHNPITNIPMIYRIITKMSIIDILLNGCTCFIKKLINYLFIKNLLLMVNTMGRQVKMIYTAKQIPDAQVPLKRF